MPISCSSGSCQAAPKVRTASARGRLVPYSSRSTRGGAWLVTSWVGCGAGAPGRGSVRCWVTVMGVVLSWVEGSGGRSVRRGKRVGGIGTAAGGPGSGTPGPDRSEAQCGDALHDGLRIRSRADRRERAEQRLADRPDHGGRRQLGVLLGQFARRDARDDDRLGEQVVAAPVGEPLLLDEWVDRFGQQCPGRTGTAQRAVREDLDERAQLLGGTAPCLRGPRTALSSWPATCRKTAASSSCLEAKWLYTLPVATAGPPGERGDLGRRVSALREQLPRRVEQPLTVGEAGRLRAGGGSVGHDLNPDSYLPLFSQPLLFPGCNGPASNRAAPRRSRPAPVRSRPRPARSPARSTGSCRRCRTGCPSGRRAGRR